MKSQSEACSTIINWALPKLFAQKISKFSSFYPLSTLLFFSLSFQGFLLQLNIFWQFLANTLSPFFVLQSATLKMRLLLKSKTRLTRLAYGRKCHGDCTSKKKPFSEKPKNLTRMRTFSFFRYLFHRTGYRNFNIYKLLT